MTGWTRALIITPALGLAVTLTVSAHMAYSKSMPAEDAALAESPSELQVWFTQDPEPAVSQLSLKGPTGDIALGETMIASDRSIVAALEDTLGPGEYTVKWRSAGDDGHVLRGDFSFTVRAAN